jgi:hypothetical protein
MFDSLHTGIHCAQVKCLGRRLADLAPGHGASLVRSATAAELAAHPEPAAPSSDATPAEFDAWADDPHTRLVYDGVARPEVTSWQVCMDGDLFATFTDSVFVGIDATRRRGHQLVDNAGHDVADSDVDVRRGWLSSPDDCEHCRALRAPIELFGAAGTPAVAAELLGVTPEGFDELVASSRVLVVHTAEGATAVPLAQFHLDGDRAVVVDGLAEVLSALGAPEQGAALRWLGWPNRRLGGVTPWEALVNGDDARRVAAAAAAQHDAWTGARR